MIEADECRIVDADGFEDVLWPMARLDRLQDHRLAVSVKPTCATLTSGLRLGACRWIICRQPSHNPHLLQAHVHHLPYEAHGLFLNTSESVSESQSLKQGILGE